jgi:hypothetical protein
MALDRNQMLARLKAMPAAEFEELIFNARIRDIIPRNEPQLVRAIAVIEYFEGPGPHQTWTTLESLVENPPTHPPSHPSTHNHHDHRRRHLRLLLVPRPRRP